MPAAVIATIVFFSLFVVFAAQNAFSTTALTPADWLRCAVVGSSILWLLELGKIVFPRGRDISLQEPNTEAK